MIDLLGFTGSSLIVLSLTMKSIVRLRVVGIAGALVFIAYGPWLGAWPVVATNTVTLSVHSVRLRSLLADGTARRAVSPRSSAESVEVSTSLINSRSWLKPH